MERAHVIYGIICVPQFQVPLFKAIDGPKKKKLSVALSLPPGEQFKPLTLQ